MASAPPRTPEGDAATDMVLQTFRANGRLLAAGDLIAGEEGLTSALWQVLGALALAGRPLTVPQIARRMGLTRQSVQVSVNRLRDEQLVEAEENPDHRRSPLIRLTQGGRDRYARVDRRQVRWINEIAAGIEASELATAARVLGEIGDRVESGAGIERKEGTET